MEMFLWGTALDSREYEIFLPAERVLFAGMISTMKLIN